MPAPPAPAPDQPTLTSAGRPSSHVGVGQQLNLSYFRPEFAGKPEEDAEAHLLCTHMTG